jgi:hypothetical protein
VSHRYAIPNGTGAATPCLDCNSTTGHTPECLLRPMTMRERTSWGQQSITPEWPSYAVYCRRCHRMAVHHPKTKRIIGCPQCKIVTTAVFYNFSNTRPQETTKL